MAKLTELLKAIGNKKVLANESNDSYLAMLVRVGGEFDQQNYVYLSYDVQVVICDLDGNVKVGKVLKADAPDEDTVENTVEFNIRVLGDDGVAVGINYYNKQEDEFLYHEETL